MLRLVYTSLILFCGISISYAQCEIRDIIVEPYDCESDGTYLVDIDFIYENTSDSFDLDSNGDIIGRYAYSDLPITAGPFDGNCDVGRSFAIFDADDMSCADDFFLDPVCCDHMNECSITDLTITMGDCIDGEYSITIDFNVSFPDNDFFDLWVNGEFEGFYSLGDLPLTIDGITPRENSDYDIVRVCINDNEDCCAVEEYLQPDCDSSSDCFIRDIIVEPYDCESDGTYLVDIDFIYENTSDSFDLDSNGDIIGRYAYSDLPITAGPFDGNCDVGRSFAIFDADDMSCADDFFLDPVCCDHMNECSITDLTITMGDCIDGEYSITIDFNVSFPDNDFFDLWVNGEFEGFYSLGDLPLTIDGITPRENSDYDIVRVCINDNEDCCAVEEYLQPACDSSSDCFIRDIIVEPYDCESDGTYLVDIDFIYENTSDSFDLDSNGDIIGRYAYSDLPITAGPFEGNCDVGRSFAIFDADDMSCADDFYLDPVCCDDMNECSITDLSITMGDCIDGEYSITIDFNVSFPDNDFFDLWVNGEFEGFYSLGDLPLTIDGITPRENSDYDIVRVCINDNEDCCAVEEYLQPGCQTTENNDLAYKAHFNLWITDELLIIDNPTNQSLTTKIYDFSGQLLVTLENVNSGLTSHPVSLNSGLHIIKIMSPNNERYTFKIFK